VVVLGGLVLAPAHRPGGTASPGGTGRPAASGPATVAVPTPSVADTALGQTEVRPPAKLVTAAGFDVAAWPSQSGTPALPSVVYDRAHHRYVQVHYSDATPAPTGTLVVVASQDYPYPVSLLDTATGATTPLSIEGYEPRDPSWSPDGSKLLFRVDDRSIPARPYGFAVVDVATRQSRTVWLPESRYDSSDVQFNWYPDGTKVALSIADRAHSSEGTGDAVLHLQLFDLAGNPAGTVPVKTPAPAAHAWSPDRRYLVGVNADPAVDLGAVVLVDTRTGTVVAKLPDVEDAWWLDATHLVARVSTYDRAHGQAEVDSLAELDVSTLSGGAARYERSTPLPAVSGDSPGLVLYPHRG
jgi:hypothetical protein